MNLQVVQSNNQCLVHFSPAHALGVRLRRIRSRLRRDCSNGEAVLVQRSAGSAVAWARPQRPWAKNDLLFNRQKV